MKQMIIPVFAAFLLISCEKGLTVYQMRILLKNGTDSTMTVTLYPKSKYVRYGSKYSFSDMNSIYKETSFLADRKLGTELYSTDTLNMEPHILVNRVFDSINVKLSSGKILKFSHMGVVNYPTNPFSDKSAWVYQKNILEHVRTWRDNRIESEDYIFIIE